MNNDHGFTLGELLVTVAIVGILSSLATTRYEKSKRKSVQAEVKLKLSSFYTLEKAFYSEYAAYVPDFGAIGFSPEGAKQWYMCGWVSAPWTHTITGYPGSFTNAWLTFNVPIESTFATNTTGCPVALNLNNPPFNQDDPQSITGMCVGYLADFNPCDYWTMDNTRRLINVTNGL